MEKTQAYPHSCKDEQGRLRAAAAIGVGPDGLARAEALLDAGVDVIVVDTAHGHSKGVMAAVGQIKRLSNAAQVVAGNVATAEGARALVDAGADGVKVGIRSEEHTSELQSLMRISYAVFCLKKKKRSSHQ